MNKKNLNERITESLVREILHKKGYYSDSSIIIEEQKSQNPRIDKLLKNASKSGKGKGFPEFIISFADKPEELLVIECKADTLKHESSDRKKYTEYAVDGVLLYASYLKDNYTVVSIAISGQTEKELKISSFLWLKGNISYIDLLERKILSPADIHTSICEKQLPISDEVLIKTAIHYNEFLHKYSIPETERCTLISSILIALQHKPFLNSYKSYTHKENTALLNQIYSACENVLIQHQLSMDKIKIVIDEYKKFQNSIKFTSDFIKKKRERTEKPNTILRDFISQIHEDILPYISQNKFDILGKFYTQFIRYAGGDKKTGLVLTPSHVTDFFCDIVELTENDIVIDPCCGTGGFLVSSMNCMVGKVHGDVEKINEIKASQLIGIEERTDMFTHACSNMMMRGDGKSLIYQGDCFTDSLKKEIKDKKPTVAFLNPPYQDGNADEQLEFVENALEYLSTGGRCVAICQMSTVVSNKHDVLKIKERLLKKHTLKAVFSMPNDLFNPVSVVTAILVFEANIPHSTTRKTFFGYFKSDGFVKTKNKGRFDKSNIFDSIKKSWLEKYINKESVSGESIVCVVGAENEWCAEAYMETNYSAIKEGYFIETIKNYSAFLFANNLISEATIKAVNFKKKNFDTSHWKYHDINDIFDEIERAKCSNAKELLSKGDDLFYVGAKKKDNGVMERVNRVQSLVSKGNALVFIGDGQGSVGYTTYQPINFIGSMTLTLGYSKKLNQFNALFLVTVLDLERYRYSFGRKYGKTTVETSKIRLPTTSTGEPDWQFMEDYIKSLPYSSNL